MQGLQRTQTEPVKRDCFRSNEERTEARVRLHRSSRYPNQSNHNPRSCKAHTATRKRTTWFPLIVSQCVAQCTNHTSKCQANTVSLAKARVIAPVSKKKPHILYHLCLVIVLVLTAKGEIWTRYVEKGDWVTLQTFYNSGGNAYFQFPIEATIKVRYGFGWLVRMVTSKF